MSTIALGTSSWNFSEWKGPFYPQSLPNSEMLGYYASKFPTVEVNTSFYALPKPATLIRWLESVPPGFTFALKAPRAITHEKRLVHCREETLAYLDAIRSLGAAAAPGLLQLPPSLTRLNDGISLARFLEWLAPKLTDVQLAVEVRAPDLMTAAFAEFVHERGIGLVLVDRVNTEDLFPTWMKAQENGKRMNFAFIRWIGDDRNGPKGNSEITNPRDAELADWCKRIVLLAATNVSVYGYMHNPYEGHSPASVRRLVALVAGEISLPPWPPDSWKRTGEKGENGSQLSFFDE